MVNLLMSNEDTKVCSKCHERKSLADFAPHTHTKDRRHSWCHRCACERVKARYHANKPPEPESKDCTRCGKDRLINMFKRGKRGGRHAWCAICIDPELSRGEMIRCTHCEESKLGSEFTFRASWCKICQATAEGQKRQKDSLYARRSLLRSRYGLTLEDYDRMLYTQGGGCAICGRPPREGGPSLHVDHDHRCCSGSKKTCGKCIRGLLCYPCNSKLAVLESDKEFHKRMRAYVGVEVIRL